MIPPTMLYTLSFPWMLISLTGELIDAQDGTLFKLSAEAQSPQSTIHCLTAPVGWSRCPAGYAVYCRELAALSGARVALRGLKVVGISSVSGKSDSLSIRTSPEEIERYFAKTLAAFLKVEEDINNIMRRSVHEVRNINKDVKSATDNALWMLEEDDFYVENLRNTVLNIKSLSEILTSQTDFLDYFVNQASALAPDRNVQVHNKIFKARESLRNRAAAKGIEIRLFGQSNATIEGKRIFEVVPFILLENAIKYSPENHPVDVIFQETPDLISVIIRNFGPHLEEDEINQVFELGRRGRNAEAARVSGYGIGLHFAKELVERHHQGTIELRQTKEARQYGSVEYRLTEMVLTFARAR